MNEKVSDASLTRRTFMIADRYLRIVLTVIAAALVAIAARPWLADSDWFRGVRPTPAHAQGAGAIPKYEVSVPRPGASTSPSATTTSSWRRPMDRCASSTSRAGRRSTRGSSRSSAGSSLVAARAVEGAAHANESVPLSVTSDRVIRRSRWHSHGYNRADLYRLAGSLGWLPRTARLRLARAIGRLAPHLMPAERAAIRATLARVTGAADNVLDAMTAATFSDFAMCFSDLLSTNRQPAARLAAHVARVEGADRVAALGGGFISLTAHVGNWELAGRLLAGRAGRPTHVVVAEDEATDLTRWMRRDGDGMRFVPRSRPTVSLDLVAALRRGEVVAVQGDRALGTRGDALIPFFGVPAPFPLGPFVLARAVGVPLVPAFCVLDASYRYSVHVAEPLLVVRGDEEAAAGAWVRILERVVRERPTQWFNFFDVWNPSPP